MPYPTKKLGEICEKITDGTHQTPTYFEKGIIFLSSKNVTSGKIDWQNTKFIDEKQHLEMSSRITPEMGDILLAKNGTTGVGAIIDRNIEFDIYVSLALLRPTKGLISEFLWYFINSSLAKNQFNSRLKGVGVPNLHLKEIREVIIPLPPLPIQKRIVEKLDASFEKIDKSIELTKKNLENIEELKKSVLEKVFNEGDYEISFGDEEYLEIIDGDRGKNYPKKSEFSTEGYCLFLNTSNVRRGFFNLDKLDFITKEKYNLLGKGKVKTNDIILTTRGTIGNCAYVEENFPYNFLRINSGMVIVRCNLEEILPKYIIHFINSSYFLKQKSFLSSGSAQPQLPIGVMKKIKIPLPPLSKQKEIVHYLDTVFEKNTLLKEKYEKKLHNLEELKQSLLKEAFEGRLVQE